MQRSLNAFKGTTLYLDTMVFYAFLRSFDPATRALFTRIKAGDLQAFTSVLTFDELTERILLALIQDKYADPPLAHLRENEAESMAEFYPLLAPLLSQLRAFPNLTLFDVSAIDLVLMDENIRRFHLSARDAIHLAAMQKSGCFDILSSDEAFDRVPEVRRYTLP